MENDLTLPGGDASDAPKNFPGRAAATQYLQG